MGGDQAFLPKVKCWSVCYGYSFQVIHKLFCFFPPFYFNVLISGFHSFMCNDYRDCDHNILGEFYMVPYIGGSKNL